MDPDKLAKLYDKMTIAENSLPTITIASSLQSIGVEKLKCCLVGKVLYTKSINRDGFIRNMTALCVTKGIKSIKSLGDNCPIFHFKSKEDKSRIIVKGPWHYENSLIVLEEPTKVGDPSLMKFDKEIFWAQIQYPNPLYE